MRINIVIDSVIDKNEIGLFCDGLGNCLRAILVKQIDKNPDGSIDVYNSLCNIYKVTSENKYHHNNTEADRLIRLVVEKKKKWQDDK